QPFTFTPFDKIKDEHFQPALEQGIAEEEKEADAIAKQTEKPTFENTIVALEKSGLLLGRARRVFSNFGACNTNPTIQKLEKELAPKFSAHAAKDEGKEGKWVIRLLNTTGQPALDSLQNRALREKIMATSLARNSHGGEFDNKEVVSRTAKLRAERATLLGYPNHAAYQLEDQ